MEKKKKICTTGKSVVLDMLVYYHTILEEHTEIIEELDKIQITY